MSLHSLRCGRHCAAAIAIRCADETQPLSRATFRLAVGERPDSSVRSMCDTSGLWAKPCSAHGGSEANRLVKQRILGVGSWAQFSHSAKRATLHCRHAAF